MQYSVTWFLNGHRSSLLASLLLTSVLCLGCGGPAPLTVDMPLPLEDHPPLDVLRFATQASAETVGVGDDLGTLEVGKLADIVLLDANPLEDIKNTQTIWRVIKGGFVFDPEELRPERN